MAIQDERHGWRNGVAGGEIGSVAPEEDGWWVEGLVDCGCKAWRKIAKGRAAVNDVGVVLGVGSLVKIPAIRNDCVERILVGCFGKIDQVGLYI